MATGRRINVKLLIILVLSTGTLAGAAVVGHKLRKRSAADAALVAGQIALADENWPEGAMHEAGYDTGELFQMTFGVNGSTLAGLFDSGNTAGGAGFMHGTVVPLPSAVLLGGLGLLAVGGIRRWRGIAS